MTVDTNECGDMTAETRQALSESKCKDAAAMRRARVAAIVHSDFVASLYVGQLAGGMRFLHNHPKHATIWKPPSKANLMRLPQLEIAHGDR